MISHKHKCIFIHIPRTAGTFIEKTVQGVDQWNKGASEKHLLASQARRIYGEWWDEYFKFSFVRDPWARTVSLLGHANFYRVAWGEPNGRGINLEGYKQQWGYPVCVENDYRFSNREDLISPKHIPNAVYSNILDEELDFIGKYENLEEDLKIVGSELGIGWGFRAGTRDGARAVRQGTDWCFPRSISMPQYSYTDLYDEKSKEEVGDLYRHDITRFDYSYGDGGLIQKHHPTQSRVGGDPLYGS